MEEDVLKFWKDQDIISKADHINDGHPVFMFYEGPPTANGKPGIHHVIARIFKDTIPRYKSMQGFKVPRKGGWDTHGLPVELEVEKKLGLSTKQEIEEFGIAEFNDHCRKSVMSYVKEWETMTHRIGFWIDLEKPYVTYDNTYIETCWWIIKELWDNKLIYEGKKVTPHCPRCVTTLSSHEVALGYEENTPDPSAYVQFEVDLDASLNICNSLAAPRSDSLKTTLSKLGDVKQKIYLLAWTTTPWTLPGNTALAINPNSEYSLVHTRSPKNDEDLYLLLGSNLLGAALQDKFDIIATFQGSHLSGLKYKPLYDPFSANLPGGSLMGFNSDGLQQINDDNLHETRKTVENSWQVHEADFVSMKEGTGIVHVAPAFGQDDYVLGESLHLLLVQHVNPEGKIIGNYKFSGDDAKKQGDTSIARDLEERCLIYKQEIYRHTYPFCWRCHTPLLYYAKPSWYIRTTAIRDKLISKNQDINWYPSHIKNGRFGEWLESNIDWAISRERYWGTPLPIWKCSSCSNYRCVGSIKEMQSAETKQSKDASNPVDLHRPWVDEIIFQCPECGSDMKRIPDVVDVWFDSGAMPLAQYHYPFENQSILSDGGYPADYICEAVDQTRGWFYSLHAIATLLEHTSKGAIQSPSYKNVICLGLILDKNGEKMSKSKGNVIEPWSVINAHGADALRWYFFTAGPPGNSRRFSLDLVGKVVRKFLLTIWNTYNFFITYANIDDFNPHEKNNHPMSELDRWIISELHLLIKDVTDSMEKYNPTDACRRLEEFSDMLSNWYVRRSRRRFWKSENDEDKLSAYHTLYDCLVTVAHLLAPFTPFLAESLYQNLVRSIDSKAAESVHLQPWQKEDSSLIDESLSTVTRLAMMISSLGRSARSKAQIRVRQPLSTILVKAASKKDEAAVVAARNQILDELNIKDLILIEDETDIQDLSISLNETVLGPKYGSQIQNIKKELSKLSQESLIRSIRDGKAIRLDNLELTSEDVVINTTEKPGYSTATDSGYTVAVATKLSQQLKEEGLARELIHFIQNMRRSAKFDIADHISIYYEASPDICKVIDKFIGYINQETLCDQLEKRTPPANTFTETHRLEDSKINLGIQKK